MTILLEKIQYGNIMGLFRRKRRISIQGYKGQREIFIHPKASPIRVEVLGYDNVVKILSPNFRGQVFVQGVGNTIIIEEGVSTAGKVVIATGYGMRPCFHCTVRIGRNTHIGSGSINLWEDGSSVLIGERCMFANDVDVWCTDMHAIWDSDGEQLLGQEVRIGNHVWVGKGARIGKNTSLADGCVVGWGSVVTKRFEEPNCIIAGVPASVRKRGIRWDSAMPNEVQKNRLRDRYPDWARLAPPPPLLRPFLQLKLAWHDFRAAHSNGAKKNRQLRKADTLRRKLGEE